MFKGCENDFGNDIRGVKRCMNIKGCEKNDEKFKGCEKIGQKFKGCEKNIRARKKCSRWVPSPINVPPLTSDLARILEQNDRNFQSLVHGMADPLYIH